MQRRVLSEFSQVVLFEVQEGLSFGLKKELHDPKAGVEPVATWPLLSAEGRHGRRVDCLPQDVPPGSGILTQGVLEGFLEDPQVFALTLSAESAVLALFMRGRRF